MSIGQKIRGLGQKWKAEKARREALPHDTYIIEWEWPRGIQKKRASGIIQQMALKSQLRSWGVTLLGKKKIILKKASKDEPAETAVDYTWRFPAGVQRREFRGKMAAGHFQSEVWDRGSSNIKVTHIPKPDTRTDTLMAKRQGELAAQPKTPPTSKPRRKKRTQQSVSRMK